MCGDATRNRLILFTRSAGKQFQLSALLMVGLDIRLCAETCEQVDRLSCIELVVQLTVGVPGSGGAASASGFSTDDGPTSRRNCLLSRERSENLPFAIQCLKLSAPIANLPVIKYQSAISFAMRLVATSIFTASCVALAMV